MVAGPLLGRLTTLRVGGPADFLCSPGTPEEVASILLRARRVGVPWRVLGRGSNLVVHDDGVEGFVLRTVRMRSLRIDPPEPDAPDCRVVAGAGLSTARLLAATRGHGLGGLECLVGYPATVGGVARMNAGGRWGNASERIESVTVVDDAGSVQVLSARDCRFGYRTSALGRYVVVEVGFRLPRVDQAAYRRRVREIHAEKTAAQPLRAASAGCVFKNPEGESAGRIVDACGLKGRTRGRARVSRRHGNFFVTEEGATADDVLGLIADVREEVARRTGVGLELEVEVWRRP